MCSPNVGVVSRMPIIPESESLGIHNVQSYAENRTRIGKRQWRKSNISTTIPMEAHQERVPMHVFVLEKRPRDLNEPLYARSGWPSTRWQLRSYPHFVVSMNCRTPISISFTSFT
jgi:hypothetical protein